MTVKAWLKGDHFDLETLVRLFHEGDPCVAKEGDEYYLTSTEMDHSPDVREVHAAARKVLERLNGVARAMQPDDYRVVELVGRYEIGPGRQELFQTDIGEVRDRAAAATVAVGSATIETRAHVFADAYVTQNGESVASAPAAGPTFMALAVRNADVAEALAIMGDDELDWVNLYKVYEIIRDNIKPAKIEDRGWASKQEQSRFTGSANRPDVSGLDARHARVSGESPTHIMSLQQARHFIGDLAVKWMSSFKL